MFSEMLASILSNLLYFALHVSGGSFPKPLSAAQERELVEKSAAGDKAARDKLIEHNLRLVAHIVKKYTANPNDQD